MSLFPKKSANKKSRIKNIEFLKAFECKVCPYKGNTVYPPKGSDSPDIYFLGEDPTSLRNQGMLSEVLSRRIKHRKVGCVRCKVTSEDIEELALQCCKNSIVQDIENTEPKIVIGIGYIPLKWLCSDKLTSKYGVTGIKSWRGRIFPVKIGKHLCWYMPIFDPKTLDIKKEKHLKTTIKFDVHKAIEFLKDYKEPVEYKKYLDKISIFTTPDLEIVRKELSVLVKEEYLALDIETTKLTPYKKDGEMYTISVGTFDNTIAFPTYKEFWGEQYKEFMEVLEWFIMNSGKKIVHNLQFEALWMLFSFGQKALRETEWTDTMAIAYTLDERSGSEREQNSVAATMLGLGVQTLINLGFNLKALSNIDFANIKNEPIEEVLRYNGGDVKWLYVYYEILIEKLRKDPELIPTANRIIQTQITLAITKSQGLLVDIEELDRIHDKLLSEIIPIEKKILKSSEMKEFKRRFKRKPDLNSNKDMVKIFRDILKYKIFNKTKSEGYGVDGESLKHFATKGSIAAKYLQPYRDKNKILSTYTTSIKELTDLDGMVRGDYSCTYTSTGRLAASNPNMQNFPKHKGKYVRKIITAPEGYIIVSIDYGQIEARAIAMVSNDSVFIEAIQKGYDIHKAWAKRIIELQPDVVGLNSLEEATAKIISNFRQKVKNKMVFPFFFNASKFGAARDLKLNDSTRDSIYEEFWKKFRKAKKWQQQTELNMKKDGYVATLTSRRRRIPLKVTEFCNSPVQGSASDIVIDAMNRLSYQGYELDKPQYQAKINVHDDLTFIIHEDTLEEDVYFICKEMCRPAFDFIKRTKVPLAVEVSMGRDWYNMEDVHVFSTEDFKYNN